MMEKLINWLLNLWKPELPNSYWVRTAKSTYALCLDTKNPDHYGCLHYWSFGKWVSYKKLTMEELYYIREKKDLLTQEMKNVITDIFNSRKGYGYIYEANHD